MKVTACKTIDVEYEVEVSLEDCINEMLDIPDKDENNGYRRLRAVDGAMKVLEKVGPDTVADVLAKNPKAIEVIRQRLKKWVDLLKGNDK